MAVAALVLGILATALNLTCFWLPFFGHGITIVLGIIAVILGPLALKKQPEKKGFCLAGLILGIIGILLGIIGIICYGVLLSAMLERGDFDWTKMFELYQDYLKR